MELVDIMKMEDFYIREVGNKGFQMDWGVCCIVVEKYNSTEHRKMAIILRVMKYEFIPKMEKKK